MIEVRTIQVAPGARLPVKSLEIAVIETGHGITGDRYENSRHRHVSVQSLEEISKAEYELLRPIDAGLTRRNITISAGSFNRTPGSILIVGPAANTHHHSPPSILTLMEMIEFADDEVVPIKELVDLYSASGWIHSAADPDQLARAVDRSTYVVTARDEEGTLIGLTRCLSDDVSVMYLQEVIVHPDHDQTAIASILVQRCLSHHSHVRQNFVLTDEAELSKGFFETVGYRSTEQLKSLNLQTLVQFDGVGDISD